MLNTLAVVLAALVVVAAAARVWRWRSADRPYRYTGSNPAVLARQAFADGLFGAPPAARRRWFHRTRR
jgi:hypothetical protein